MCIRDRCKFASYEPRTLMIHMRIHSGDKPNKCSQCNYASHQEGNLKSHLKTHSGEKDYKCDKCNYKAARAEHMKSHMKRHTRLYKCNCCNDAFNLDNDSRSHLKTHIDGQLLSNLQRQTQLGDFVQSDWGPKTPRGDIKRTCKRTTWTHVIYHLLKFTCCIHRI